MTEKDALIEVKTYHSVAEISSIEGFRNENPINKENYDRIIGDYWFDDEVKCCFEKTNGNLCNEGHKRGYVARLKDESVTIVGNVCARDKFGADAKIKADRSRYINEKRRLQRLETVKQLLSERNERLVAISEIRNDLRKISSDRDKFLEKVGPIINRKLIDMSRTGNTSVVITAVNLRKYIDEDGDSQVERRTTQATIGHIEGVIIFNKIHFDSIYSVLGVVERIYERVSSISDDVKSSELDHISSQLGKLDLAKTQARNLSNAAHAFFNSDLSLLCFIVGDKSERYKAARVAMEQKDIFGGKERAKQWLNENEQILKNNLNADRLEVLG